MPYFASFACCLEENISGQKQETDIALKKRAIVRRHAQYIQNEGGIFSGERNVNHGTQTGISYDASQATKQGGTVVVGYQYSDENKQDGIIIGLSATNSHDSATPIIHNRGGIFSGKDHVNTGEQVEIGIAVQPAHKTEHRSLGYYWQEYTGAIRNDALPAGKDIYGADTYIGQAPIHQRGIFIGEIFPAKRNVEFQSYGVEVLQTGIKILSTQQKQKFTWLHTKATSFYADTANKHVVIGGQNYVEPKQLNVCRLRYGGTLRVGAVAPIKGRDTYCYFAENGKQEVIDEYEVLIYDE